MMASCAPSAETDKDQSGLCRRERRAMSNGDACEIIDIPFDGIEEHGGLVWD